MTYAISKLERFSAGERFAVDPDAIERELASLWRAAGASTPDATHHPVTRACRWNVILHLEERAGAEGHGGAQVLEGLVKQLPRFLAARSLVLRTFPAAPPSEPELESWIAANCIPSGDGGKLVCSEEVAIVSRGNGERHLPALVRALLVPAVPTAVVFAGIPSKNDAMIAGLLAAADRLILNGNRSLDPASLLHAHEVLASKPLGGVDVAWVGEASFRELIASLFDPPTPDTEPGNITRVKLSIHPDRRYSGVLTLAWIARSLGGKEVTQAGASSWSVHRRRVGSTAATIELELALDARSAPGPRVDFFVLGPDPKYSVSAISESLAELRTPWLLEDRRALDRPRGADLLARALATRSWDLGFARALELARRM